MRDVRSMAPPVVLNLIIINCLGLMAVNLLGKNIAANIIMNCALSDIDTSFFKPWQLVSYMFLHADIFHLFFNMLPLWMFGRTLVYAMGEKRFLLYYMVCGIGAGLVQLAIGNFGCTVGASGAVFGLLLAFGMMFPNAVIMLMLPPIPIKAKWFVVIYGVLELYLGVSGRQVGVAHFAHLGGMIWGFALLKYWQYKGVDRR